MTRRLALLLLGFSMTCCMGLAGSSDEYFRLARLSYLDGHASFQHSGEVDWTAASINMPLQPGDRVYTGNDGRAEIEFDDGSVYRLAEKTDVEILSLREDLIQVRVLVGLSTLSVQSGVSFEVDTPAAAFTTLRRGAYRFDVVESGSTDAIVRKGLLEAANDQFSQQVEQGDLLHVVPGDAGAPAVSQYDQRDGWDDWNDRRNADMLAYKSRSYIPDTVNMGVSELDSYGNWVMVDAYGPAWVPYGVDASWSPYWEGRWCYRPFWGWTWVSYEPWGWLPYHYGRWYYSGSFGWCWLPGPSFGFNFWSPGLVRFYNGPGWISWCPLGPHDYYNVNNYYFNRSNVYQLNNLRLLQTRSPGDLVNRNVPGAFRTVQTDQFVGNSLGSRARVSGISVDQPWSRGQMVADRLGIQPTARSYAPAPDRPAMRPATESRLPIVVRTAPSIRSGAQERMIRITNPNVAAPTSGRPETRGSSEAGAAPARTWNRVEPSNPSVVEPGRSQTVPGAGSAGRPNANPAGSPARSQGRVIQAPQQAAPARTNPTPRPESNTPRRIETQPAPPRMDRPAAPERRTDPPVRPEPRPRSNRSETTGVSLPNSYVVQSTPSSDVQQGPRTVYFGQGNTTYVPPRYDSAGRQTDASGSAGPGYSRGGSYAAPSAPSYSGGSLSSPPARTYTLPPPRAYSPPPAGTYQAAPAARGNGSSGSGDRGGTSATTHAGSSGGHRGR